MPSNIQFIQAAYNCVADKTNIYSNDYIATTKDNVAMLEKCIKDGDKAMAAGSKCLSALEDYGFFTHSNAIASIITTIKQLTDTVASLGEPAANNNAAPAETVAPRQPRGFPAVIDTGVDKNQKDVVKSAGLDKTAPVEMEKKLTKAHSAASLPAINSEPIVKAQPAADNNIISAENVVANVQDGIVTNKDVEVAADKVVVTNDDIVITNPQLTVQELKDEVVKAAVPQVVEAVEAKAEEIVKEIKEDVKEQVAEEIKAEAQAPPANNQRLLVEDEIKAEVPATTEAQALTVQKAEGENTEANAEGVTIAATHVVVQAEDIVGAAGNVAVNGEEVIEGAAVANKDNVVVEVTVPKVTEEVAKQAMDAAVEAVAEVVTGEHTAPATNTDANTTAADTTAANTDAAVPAANTDADVTAAPIANNEAPIAVMTKSGKFAFYNVEESLENSASKLAVNSKSGINMNGNAMDKKFWQFSTKASTGSNTIYWVIGGIVLLAAIAAGVFYYLRG